MDYNTAALELHEKFQGKIETKLKTGIRNKEDLSIVYSPWVAAPCLAIEKDKTLAKKILNMDMSLIARDVRFFYPFEVQIVDKDAHKENSEGEASHSEYKKAQLKFAMNRVFKPLIDFTKGQ